ncbi:MAG: S8 family serine peptidase [Opitutales bacterium]|nr:S8 family serine peptidase [Opitutales bacterium]
MIDLNSHGTHVAGTIGAQGNNGIGVPGVAHDVAIMPVRIMNNSGSFYDNLEGIDYAVEMGSHISNHSYSYGGVFSGSSDFLMRSAFLRAQAANHIAVAAAGNRNRNNDTFLIPPASLDVDNIISVASSELNDRKSSFSSYGLESVDLAAPGGSIYSTIPDRKYGRKSGTSMATPHVAGVLALMLSRYGTDSPYTDIIELLFSATDPVDALDGMTRTGGRLNAYNAVKHLAFEPYIEVPSFVQLDAVDSQGSSITQIQILNRGIGELLIQSVATTDSAFSVLSDSAFSLGTDEEGVIEIAFTPNGIDGFVDGQIIIESNASNTAVATIDLSAYSFTLPEDSTLSEVSLQQLVSYVPFEGSFQDFTKNLAYTAQASIQEVSILNKRTDAAFFNGVDDIISIESDTSLNLGSSLTQRSFSLWFAAEDLSLPGKQVLFETGGFGRGFNAYIEAGILYAGVWDNILDTEIGDIDAWPGTWRKYAGLQEGKFYHLALVLDAASKPRETQSGAFKAYLDGVEFDTENSIAMQIAEHAGATALGNYQDNTLFEDGETIGGAFHGYIDDFAIWNRSLELEEVQSIASTEFIQLPESSTVTEVSNMGLFVYAPMDNQVQDSTNTLNLVTLSSEPIANNGGVFEGAARFGGSNNIVHFESHPLLNLGEALTQRTFSLWFAADDLDKPGKQVIFETGGWGRGFNIYLENSVLYAGVWDTIQDTVIGDESVWPGTWRQIGGIEEGVYYHVALVFDASAKPKTPHAGAFKAYLNGEEFDERNSIAMQIADHPGKTGLGNHVDHTLFPDGNQTGVAFSGYVDDFAAWNRNLSRNEIRTLAGLPPEEIEIGSTVGQISLDDIVMYAPMNDTFQDITFNLDLTPVGGISLEDDLGKFAGGAKSNGIESTMLSIKSAPSLNLSPTLTKRSFSMWFLAEDLSLPGKQVLFESGGNFRGFNAYIEGRKLYAGVWDTLLDTEVGDQDTWSGTWRESGDIQEGVYYHLALVIDAGQDPASPHSGAFKAYLNGVEFDPDNSVAMQIAAHSGQSSIANYADSSLFADGETTGVAFKGIVDDFAIWNRSLDQGEITTLSARFTFILDNE